MFMKKYGKIIAVIFTAAFGGFCLLDPVSAKAAVYDGMRRCMETVIPSLYAMMAASGLLLSTGAISAAGRYADKFSRFVFGMSGETFAAFLFSMIAGYPVGAKMICTRYRDGEISRSHGELCSGICFGAGSAFIYGCAASRLSEGKFILLSVVSANIITALILSPWLRRKLSSVEKVHREISFSPAMLTDCVSSAGRSMAEICFAVAAFSVLTAMLQKVGVISLFGTALSNLLGYSAQTSESLICALLDVTAISGFPDMDYGLMPVKAALVSFGGVCVFVQISAIFRGKLRIIPLISIRAAAAVISGIICRMLLPVYLSGEAVTAAAMNPRLHRAVSPVPSIMLMIMTAMLFAESSKRRKKGSPM